MTDVMVVYVFSKAEEVRENEADEDPLYIKEDDLDDLDDDDDDDDDDDVDGGGDNQVKKEQALV